MANRDADFGLEWRPNSPGQPPVLAVTFSDGSSFAHALDLADPEDRQRFLDAALNGRDTSLRAKLDLFIQSSAALAVE